MSNTSPRLLVTGASGQLGRRVVELLLAQEIGNIIATTRNPEGLADLAARGVDVRKADFDEEEGLAEAFAGAERLLLMSTDAVGQPGKRFLQHNAAIDAAAKAGVKHLVYTSLTHPVTDSPVLLAPDHIKTELALEASGLSYTALRNNLYADLLLMSLPAAIGMGQLFSAAGEGGAAYVTREDCARAAAAALSSDFEGKRQLEISGPQVVTYAALAEMASELSSTKVTHVPIQPHVLKAGMIQNGVPEVIADLMVSFEEGMAKGLFAPATDAVAELTGEQPMTVKSFLESHRDALVAP
jgi:NAD(P)H dehydrogenase (quinone)